MNDTSINKNEAIQKCYDKFLNLKDLVEEINHIKTLLNNAYGEMMNSNDIQKKFIENKYSKLKDSISSKSLNKWFMKKYNRPLLTTLHSLKAGRFIN